MKEKNSSSRKYGYIQTLTILIWAAAFIPVLLLTVHQLNQQYQKAKEEQRQEVAQYAQQLTTVFNDITRDTIRNFDSASSDGSIIKSLSFDVLYGDSKQQLQRFMASHPEFSVVLILDDQSNPLGAIPENLKEMDLSPYQDLFDFLFNNPVSYENPESQFLLLPEGQSSNSLAAQNYTISIARPVLKTRDSLESPFRVIGIMFGNVTVPDLVAHAFQEFDQVQPYVEFSIFYQGELIFGETGHIDNDDWFHHQESIAIGDGARTLELTLHFDKEINIRLIDVVALQWVALVLEVILLVVMFIVASQLSKRLAKPIERLKMLSEALSNQDFSEGNCCKDRPDEIYQEFHEVNELLLEMSRTIGQQFRELKDYNRALKNTTRALEDSIVEGRENHDILQSLMQFSIILQGDLDLATSCALTLDMVRRIYDKPGGLVLYRNEYIRGVELMDEAPVSFLSELPREKVYWLTQEQLSSIKQRLNDDTILTIQLHDEFMGYVVIAQEKGADFKQHAVSMFIAVLQTKIEQQLLNLKLAKQANSDAMTGLFNRMYYEKHYERLYQKQQTDGTPFSLLMIDINGLKKANDTIGHVAGDALISSVSAVLLETFRESDVVARTGGDEFTVLLEETGADICAELSKRIRQRSGEKVLTFDLISIPVSYSVGCACSEKDAPESLYDIADTRMYEDKQRYYDELKEQASPSTDVSSNIEQ